MAVDVELTSDIQNTITEAIKCDHIPQDLAERLSRYTEVSLGKQRSAEAENKVPIPFKLVKQLWECLREKQAKGKRIWANRDLELPSLYISLYACLCLVGGEGSSGLMTYEKASPSTSPSIKDKSKI